jgi:HEAT repeat protein
MVVLCCPQCQTTLPVAREKLGKALFVCPKCAFPLEAPSEETAAAPMAPLEAYSPPLDAPPPPAREMTATYVPPTAPYSPARLEVTDRTLPPAPPPPRLPDPPSVKAPGKKSTSPDRTAPERKSLSTRSMWLVGGACVWGILLLAGVVALALVGRKPAPDTTAEDPASAEVAKPVDVLEVLDVSNDLKADDVEKRKKAALALGKAGKDARVAMPALLEALKDDNDEVRALARDALDNIGEPLEGDFPILSLALRDEDPDVRAYAVGAIDSLGPDSWAEITQVRALTEDSDPYVAEEAKKTLQRMEKNILEELTRLLKDPNPDVRRNAAVSIGELGVAVRSVASSLTAALGDENPAVRVAAADALLELGIDSVPVLSESLSSANVNARRSAISALGRLGSDAYEAMPKLTSLADDPDVGNDATGALEQLGEYAVPAIVNRLEGARGDRLPQALRDTLVRIGPRGYPAIEYQFNNKTTNDKLRTALTEVINRIGKVEPPGPIVVPTGDVGVIYLDLVGQWNIWPHRHRDWITLEELIHALRRELRELREIERFLRRLDRNGDGRISRWEFEHWCHHHAHHLHRERQLLEKLRREERALRERIREDEKRIRHDAHDQLHHHHKDPTTQPSGKQPATTPKTPATGKQPGTTPKTPATTPKTPATGKHPSTGPSTSPQHDAHHHEAERRRVQEAERRQREAAAARLRDQQRRAHAEQQAKHKAMLQHQKQLASMRRHAGPGNQATPRKYLGQQRQTVHKPVTRAPIIRRAPVFRAPVIRMGGGGRRR